MASAGEGAVTDTGRLTADAVARIARDVWGSVLGLPLAAADVARTRVPTGDELCAVVGISGAWQGSVQLECPAEQARAAAEVMFGAEPGSLAEEDVEDALGELANMVGGGVKSLLPAPSALSVPAVSDVPPVRVPPSRLARSVHLAPAVHVAPTETIRIAVWAD